MKGKCSGGRWYSRLVFGAVYVNMPTACSYVAELMLIGTPHLRNTSSLTGPPPMKPTKGRGIAGANHGCPSHRRAVGCATVYQTGSLGRTCAGPV
jgi:hypothetical protein